MQIKYQQILLSKLRYNSKYEIHKWFWGFSIKGGYEISLIHFNMNYTLKYLATNVLIAFCYCVKYHDQSNWEGGGRKVLFGFTFKLWSITEGRQARAQGKSHRGTWLADLLNNSLIDSCLTSFLNSPGLPAWEMVLPTVGWALVYQLMIKTIYHRYWQLRLTRIVDQILLLRLISPMLHVAFEYFKFLVFCTSFFPASAEDRAQSCACQGHTLTTCPGLVFFCRV